MANQFKEKLKRDEVVVVVNPDHPSSSLTEFVAGLGFDGVFVDCEHGPATVERVQDMCRAARAAGVQSIVRPESNAPFIITRYLDAGAGGIMAPHVDTAAAAREIVETVRYARPKDHQDKVVVAMIEFVGRDRQSARALVGRRRGRVLHRAERSLPFDGLRRPRCITPRSRRW